MNGARLKTWARALRVDQWTKNGLVPMAWFFSVVDVSRRAVSGVGGSLLLAMALAVSFSLVSSAFYLLNDLRDRDADLLHPVKRDRPVASGAIGVRAAVRAALVLLAAGFALAAALLPPPTLAFKTLAAYAFLQGLYTGILKRIPYVDVLVIAFGFVLRAVAGAAVVTTDISMWLLVCTFTLALFLALCKRKDELETACASRAVLGWYRPKLLGALIALSGAATVLEYFAYTLRSSVGRTYPLLWLTSVFVLAGVVRYARLAWTNRGAGQPEKVLLSDRILRAVLLGYCLMTGAAVALG